MLQYSGWECTKQDEDIVVDSKGAIYTAVFVL